MMAAGLVALHLTKRVLLEGPDDILDGRACLDPAHLDSHGAEHS